MAPEPIGFDWIEYLVFCLLLGLSALIGVWFGFIKKQETVSEYFLGGKNMGLFPISVSLVSGFISGITLLGSPSEIYTYGTQYMMATISTVVVALMKAYIFIPVFYKLQVISVYEYLELRFNKNVRKMVSLFYTFALMVYIPVVIYGPALALNQVSGLNVQKTAFILCTVCIFYTTFGGLKAVVWTDTLQAVIMLAASLSVAIIGTVQVGGISDIFQAAQEGERLEFFNFDLDPRARASFWSITIGVIFSLCGQHTISPAAVQRFMSLSSLRKGKWAILYMTIGTYSFFLLSCYMGLVIYAQYQHCDPKATGMIKSSDQILPFFMMDAMKNYTGLPGVFLAGIVSSGLSVMSTGLNSLSGTMYEDFIEPWMGKTTDKRASNIMKMLAAGFGVYSAIMVIFVAKFGSIIELINSLGGVTNGPSLGIFILGLFFPAANSMGAIIGGLTGLSIICWIVSGSRAAFARGDLVYPVKPISVDNCPYNITGIDLVMPADPVNGKVFPLFEISVFYSVALGCIITVIVGLIVSYISGPNKVQDVDRSLLAPIVVRYLPDYKAVPVKEVEMEPIKS